MIIADEGKNRIIPVAAAKPVISLACIDIIVSTSALDSVIAGAGIELIIAFIIIISKSSIMFRKIFSKITLSRHMEKF